MEDLNEEAEFDFKNEINEDENLRIKRLNEKDKMYKFYKHFYINPEKNSKFNKIHYGHGNLIKRNIIRQETLAKLNKGESINYFEQSMLINHFHKLFDEKESRILITNNNYAKSKLLLSSFVSVNLFIIIRRSLMEYNNINYKNYRFKIFQFILASSLISLNYFGIKYDSSVNYNIRFLMKNRELILSSNPEITFNFNKEILKNKYEEILKSNQQI